MIVGFLRSREVLDFVGVFLPFRDFLVAGIFKAKTPRNLKKSGIS